MSLHLSNTTRNLFTFSHSLRLYYVRLSRTHFKIGYCLGLETILVILEAQETASLLAYECCSESHLVLISAPHLPNLKARRHSRKSGPVFRLLKVQARPSSQWSPVQDTDLRVDTRPRVKIQGCEIGWSLHVFHHKKCTCW